MTSLVQPKRTRNTSESELPDPKKEKLVLLKRQFELVEIEEPKRIKHERGTKREIESLMDSSKKIKHMIVETEGPFFALMGMCTEGIDRVNSSHNCETFEYPPLFDYDGCMQMIRLVDKILCIITRKSKDHGTFKFYISIFKSILHMFCTYRNSDPWGIDKQRTILGSMNKTFAQVRDYSYKQYIETKDIAPAEVYPTKRDGTEVLAFHWPSVIQLEVY
jgi:hypothetical protein